jgi:glycosyltransferase involved in cell wall biosynthesis
VLESYALGTPVVGARIGGITELIREGETGFGVESGSVDDLAAVLGQVAALPDHEVAEMGRAGRRWVVDGFCAERFVTRTSALYEELGVGTAVAAAVADREGTTTT